MAYQEGVENLQNGVGVYTITFPAAFSSTPDIVIPVVFNTSGDSPKRGLVAHVVDKDQNGFEVELDGLPDSANYQLSWIAGSLTSVFEAIQQGQRASTFPAVDGSLADQDKFLLLRFGPVIRTQTLSWEALREYFPNVVGQLPVAPTTSGAAGEIALPTAVSPWLFLHTGTLWGRIPVEVTAAGWSAQSAITSIREGLADLASGQTTHDIVFSEPFDIGVVPLVWCQIRNLVDDPFLVIIGTVTNVTHTGFRYIVHMAPDSGNYKLQYHARKSTNV